MLTASKEKTNVEWSRQIVDDGTCEDLVVACRSGCGVAQQRLYERCHQRIYRLLVRMVGNRDAEDVLQEVFLQVFRRLDQFAGQSRFETWLYRLSINESLQHIRKQSRKRWTNLECDLVDHGPSQEREFDNKELLERALGRLEPELRSLFLLREIEELSYAEIAETARIPDGTVASRLSRARKLLKQHLIELGWDP